MQFYFLKIHIRKPFKAMIFWLVTMGKHFFQNKLENTSACLSVIILFSEWYHMYFIYFLEILRVHAFMSSWVAAETDYLTFLEEVSCPG